MVAVIRGEAPSGSGSGYGYGSGSGSGSGYGSGYGDGYGYGSGSGYGDGYGYGSGSGSGYGDGVGSGDGSGYGSWSWYGYGDGDGYGDGYGYGSGDGSGYGDGVGSSYWRAILPTLADKAGYSLRAHAAQKAGAKLAYWLSDAQGRPCNGGLGSPVGPGHIDEERGPLNLCARGTLHATHLPKQWKGDRWWIVALWGEVIGDEEKYGCLKREVICEALFDE